MMNGGSGMMGGRGGRGGGTGRKSGPEHNPIISAIIAKVAPKHEPEDGDDGELSEGLKAAAEDALSAIKAGDAEAFAEALHAFFVQADSEPHEEGEDEGENEGEGEE